MKELILKELSHLVETGLGNDDSIEASAFNLETRFITQYPKAIWGYLYAEVLLAASNMVPLGSTVSLGILFGFARLGELFGVKQEELVDPLHLVKALKKIDQSKYGPIVSLTKDGELINVSTIQNDDHVRPKLFVEGELIDPR